MIIGHCEAREEVGSGLFHGSMVFSFAGFMGSTKQER